MAIVKGREEAFSDELPLFFKAEQQQKKIIRNNAEPEKWKSNQKLLRFNILPFSYSSYFEHEQRFTFQGSKEMNEQIYLHDYISNSSIGMCQWLGRTGG